VVVGDRTVSHRLALDLLRQGLGNAHFDYLQISHLTAHAGALSRTGTAEFRAHTMGSIVTPTWSQNLYTPPTGQQWSLGFRETGGAWKVTRITPVNPPPGVRSYLSSPARPG